MKDMHIAIFFLLFRIIPVNIVCCILQLLDYLKDPALSKSLLEIGGKETDVLQSGGVHQLQTLLNTLQANQALMDELCTSIKNTCIKSMGDR